MHSIDQSALERLTAGIAEHVRGPGGAIGVVKDGETILSHVWGYADPKRHLAVAASTRFPICSISKQFTCAILQDLDHDLDRFDPLVQKYLPNMETKRPSIRELCNNQSGLRDYWALTVLHGADAEGIFRREDAKPLFDRMRSTHFTPGSKYSYSNGNFRILSDIIEEVSQRSLGELYREKIFNRADMQTAELLPNTAQSHDVAVGHEGNDIAGFFVAQNRIYWSGDAGICASLDDMLAWERFIDKTRDDENSVYRRLSREQTFSDGSSAPYGNGLAHNMIGEIQTTGHGGGLRGFRLHRLYAPSERLSVVVLFNHEGNAQGTATKLMKAALGIESGAQQNEEATERGWDGCYIDRETGLVLTLAAEQGGLKALYGGSTDLLSMQGPDTAGSSSMSVTRRGDEIGYERWRENLRGTVTRVTGTAKPDIAGRYRCRELQATFEILGSDGAFYGSFEGFLGKGEMMPLYPVAEDLWTLPCRRSMDAPAPGEWTIQVSRHDDGCVKGLTIGCWLARNLTYDRAGA